MKAKGDTEQLLRLAIDGQREAFAQIIKLYERRCFAVAYRVTGDQDAALDICQDSFIQAFRQLARLREPSKFGAWLTRIVLNRARSYLRRQRAAQRRLSEATPRFAVAEATDPGASQELREALEEGIRNLPRRYREVLVLYAGDGCSHAQIAEGLGKPVKTIRWRLHHARNLLRKKLAQYL